MLRRKLSALAILLGLAASAQAAPEAPTRLYDRVSPSFVAVKYTWDFELRRQELTGPGVVVSEDGLIMAPIGVFNMIIPDAQMKDFKIIIPSQEKDSDEIDAEFVGRDERTNLAFLRPRPESADKPAAPKTQTDETKAASDKLDAEKKNAADRKAAGEKKSGGDGDDAVPAKEKPRASGKAAKDASAGDSAKAEPAAAKKSDSKPARKWAPIRFEQAKFTVGEQLWSVGVLPEAASFKTYLMDARVAATLRGESPSVLVSGGLCGIGAVVFNVEGKAVGYVNQQTGQNVFLNDGPNALAAINNPPKFFTPTSDFDLSLTDLPVAGKPMELPWIGVPNMTGLTKDVAEFYALKGQPAVQIGDTIPDAPAAKAGLKQGDIVVKVNGKPLERGDEAEELPMILRRQLIRMKVGDEVTLSVVRKRNAPPTDIAIKMEAQPRPMNLAARYYAEDLGFGVREMVFQDTYSRRLPADSKGVVVSLIKPQSNAQSGGLQGNSSPRSDVIISLNGEQVTDIKQFQSAYEKIRKDKPKEPVVLVVQREGRENTVRIEPPQ